MNEDKKYYNLDTGEYETYEEYIERTKSRKKFTKYLYDKYYGNKKELTQEERVKKTVRKINRKTKK